MPEDPDDPAGGMLLLRAGSRAALCAGVRRVLRTRTHIRVQVSSGQWLELRRLGSSRL